MFEQRGNLCWKQEQFRYMGACQLKNALLYFRLHFIKPELFILWYLIDSDGKMKMLVAGNCNKGLLWFYRVGGITKTKFKSYENEIKHFQMYIITIHSGNHQFDHVRPNHGATKDGSTIDTNNQWMQELHLLILWWRAINGNEYINKIIFANKINVFN